MWVVCYSNSANAYVITTEPGDNAPMKDQERGLAKDAAIDAVHVSTGRYMNVKWTLFPALEKLIHHPGQVTGSR
jgi:hypothetical protein